MRTTARIYADRRDPSGAIGSYLKEMGDRITEIRVRFDQSQVCVIDFTYIPEQESPDEDIEPLCGVSVPCIFPAVVDLDDRPEREAGAGGASDSGDDVDLTGEISGAVTEADDYFTGQRQTVRLSRLAGRIRSYFAGIKGRISLFCSASTGHGPVRRTGERDHGD